MQNLKGGKSRQDGADLVTVAEYPACFHRHVFTDVNP